MNEILRDLPYHLLPFDLSGYAQMFWYIVFLPSFFATKWLQIVATNCAAFLLTCPASLPCHRDPSLSRLSLSRSHPAPPKPTILQSVNLLSEHNHLINHISKPVAVIQRNFGAIFKWVPPQGQARHHTHSLVEVLLCASDSE